MLGSLGQFDVLFRKIVEDIWMILRQELEDLLDPEALIPGRNELGIRTKLRYEPAEWKLERWNGKLTEVYEWF